MTKGTYFSSSNGVAGGQYGSSDARRSQGQTHPLMRPTVRQRVRYDGILLPREVLHPRLELSPRFGQVHGAPALRLLVDVRRVVVVDLDEGLDRLVVSQIIERDCRQTVVGAIAVNVGLHHVFGVTEEMRRHLDVVLLHANRISVYVQSARDWTAPHAQ